MIDEAGLGGAPIAANTVTGTAIANAHGAAATSTTKPARSTAVGSPASDPTIATRAATIMIAGHQRSGDAVGEALGRPLRSWASSTMCTMRASVLSAAAAVAIDLEAPPPLMLPASTRSPRPTSIGIDSPVTADMSSIDRPSTTTPSVDEALARPHNTITSPAATLAVGTSTTSPSRRSRAVVGHQLQHRSQAPA